MAIHNANKRAAEAAEDETVSALSGVGCRLYIQQIPCHPLFFIHLLNLLEGRPEGPSHNS
jgi:hypothetical protein